MAVPALCVKENEERDGERGETTEIIPLFVSLFARTLKNGRPPAMGGRHVVHHVAARCSVLQLERQAIPRRLNHHPHLCLVHFALEVLASLERPDNRAVAACSHRHSVSAHAEEHCRLGGHWVGVRAKAGPGNERRSKVWSFMKNNEP